MLNIIATIDDKRPEELGLEMAELCQAFFVLQTRSEDLVVQMQENKQQNEDALKSCEDSIEGKNAAKESIKSHIDELNDQISKSDISIAHSKALVTVYANSVNVLRSKIKQSRERYEELKKLLWVPLYSQYLTIRFLLTDNEIENYKSTANELRKFQGELKSGVLDNRRLSQIKLQLNKALVSHQQEINGLEEVRKSLQKERGKIEPLMILFKNLGLYYQSLANKLQLLIDKPGKMNKLIQLPNQEVSLFLANDGKEEVMSLTDAIIRLSELAATIPYEEKIQEISQFTASTVAPGQITDVTMAANANSSFPVIRLGNRSFHFVQGSKKKNAPLVISRNEKGNEVGRLPINGISQLSHIQLGIGSDIGLFGPNEKMVLLPWTQLQALG